MTIIYEIIIVGHYCGILFYLTC